MPFADVPPIHPETAELAHRIARAIERVLGTSNARRP